MTNPFRACAGVWGGRADHDANIAATFTLRLTAVMLLTEARDSRIADHKITRLDELMPWRYAQH